MIEDIKKNIEQEKRLISELNSVLSNASENKSFYAPSIKAMTAQLKILNNSIPNLLNTISPIKPLKEPKKVQSEVIKISYVSPSTKEKKFVTINKKDKESFIKELQISEAGLSSLRNTPKESIIVNKPSTIAQISSKLFSTSSERLARQFPSLSEDIRKANIRFLTSTYISIALFISSLVFISSLIITIFLTLTSLLSIIWIWLPILFTLISLTLFYFYPYAERSSVQKKILQELPFATIHMAAIAGSNVEPTKIFKIIAMSNEYPTIGIEIKKLLNQTELYGYDLVTALKNSAKQTSNSKLAEMFSGLATNISTGGDLKNYLDKKAQNLLLDYKLERQSYTELAGTFMDVYISILITAPLILMMMIIVMNLSGLGIAGLSLNAILTLSIAAVILINIIFMVVLEIKQPKN
jgi:archaeal flagellar protein FlaJ